MSETVRTEAALTGRLEAIPLFDLCQFLMLNRRTGTLAVRNNDNTVRIYFEEGAILDIMDDALRRGERILLGAVQWPTGSFTFDPTPTGAERRIEASTEAILLEAARLIDEARAQAGESGRGPTQETSFREKQTVADELPDVFRRAIEPVGHRSAMPHDPLDELLRDLALVRGTLIMRDGTAILRSREGTRAYPTPMRAEDLLERLGLPAPDAGEARNHRFERPAGWFHVRTRRPAGSQQVLLAFLTSELPSADELGLDPEALSSLLEHEGGLVLWTGLPHGYRSTALAGWLGNAKTRGPVLWLEEAPRIAWEDVPGLCRHVGSPLDGEAMAGLMEWNPEIIVIDSLRSPHTAGAALEMVEAGVTVLAVAPGLTLREGVGGFLRSLNRCGLLDADSRLARALSGWVGILPVREEGLGPPLVAAQIVRNDSSLAAIIARGATDHDLREWSAGRTVHRSWLEELDRLEQAGRIDEVIRTRIRQDLSGLDF
jgi:hypothetical protein